MLWRTIEESLNTLEAAIDGYSAAHRGLVTLAVGSRVFVKIGTDEKTKEWAKKEIAVYEFLAQYSFTSVPTLIAYNDQRTSFALEPLESDNGWNWKKEWSHDRLRATLQAMDELASIELSSQTDGFKQKSMSETSNGWIPLAESSEKQAALWTKLEKAGHAEFMSAFDIESMAHESKRYGFINDSLVHNDVRADNCAWNQSTKQVKLIDWNWLQIGDRRMDINAMLVDVFVSGFDPIPYFADRIDVDALQWLGGFWLHASATPITPGGSEKIELRDYQMESGVAALRLRELFLEYTQKP